MKVGIDSYCYHRFFGEVYPQQKKPAKKMTLEGFIKRAKELKVDGVSLESCFISPLETGYLTEVKGMLDEYKLDRVFAWGHPDGLEGGRNAKMFDDMVKSIEYAKAIGAKVMRVVGSSLMFRFEPHGPQIERLSKMFSKAVKVAEKAGVKLAVENHIDFNADEMLAILKNVDSPYMGINFDTGNFVRVLDDPIKAMKKLSKYVFATHIKDLRIQKGRGGRRLVLLLLHPRRRRRHRGQPGAGPDPGGPAATRASWRWRSTSCTRTSRPTRTRRWRPASRS